MTNTQLDQRVAELRGWKKRTLNDPAIGPEEYWCSKDHCVTHRLVSAFTPSTNLTQAMGLWQEHRPGDELLAIVQHEDLTWSAWNACEFTGNESDSSFDSLPRAITEAWVEAKEQEGKRWAYLANSEPR